jgi:hypothetical protein
MSTRRVSRRQLGVTTVPPGFTSADRSAEPAGADWTSEEALDE